MVTSYPFSAERQKELQQIAVERAKKILNIYWFDYEEHPLNRGLTIHEAHYVVGVGINVSPATKEEEESEDLLPDWELY